ncbi:alcohol dehydrogenase family protein [Roseospira navarrensis]|uniref:Zinc-binding dehydrogenase n=1 Tax=Roseospira navarrensis TaxID=140058 RepID=A0A7X2D2E9_9PROT|nr:alcohol dehydrogenase family protein [Roseospira navarrensis]MQX35616.1 zinc-binding dehydrogenase [Roseospira navarrensis]
MTDIPETMRGVWLTAHGDLDCLDYRTDIPTPRPGPGDVLIRVTAAGVNNTDINTRVGWYSKKGNAAEDASWSGSPLSLPRIQGIDACGRIVAVGPGVDAARIGERVLVEPCLREAGGRTLDQPWYFGSECDGAFADYTVVAGRHAHRIDSPLDDVALASFPCSYSTAENLLTRAGVAAGERVLVTGASGGVGSAAVQLARVRDAEVIAVTSPAKAETLRGLGAARCLSRDDDVVETLGKDSVDVVVDLVGGPRWPALLDALRPGGRYAASGAIAGPMVTLDLRTLYLKDLTLFGGTALTPDIFPALIAAIESGRVRPLVAETYPLARIREAQTAFLAKGFVGKIVLTLDA